METSTNTNSDQEHTATFVLNSIDSSNTSSSSCNQMSEIPGTGVENMSVNYSSTKCDNTESDTSKPASSVSVDTPVVERKGESTDVMDTSELVVSDATFKTSEGSKGGKVLENVVDGSIASSESMQTEQTGESLKESGSEITESVNQQPDSSMQTGDKKAGELTKDNSSEELAVSSVNSLENKIGTSESDNLIKEKKSTCLSLSQNYPVKSSEEKEATQQAEYLTG